MIAIVNGGIFRGGQFRGGIFFDGSSGPSGPPVNISPPFIQVSPAEDGGMFGGTMSVIDVGFWENYEILIGNYYWSGDYGSDNIPTDFDSLSLNQPNWHNSFWFLSIEAFNSAGSTTADSNDEFVTFKPAYIYSVPPDIVNPVGGNPNPGEPVEMSFTPVFNNDTGDLVIIYDWWLNDAYFTTETNGTINIPDGTSGQQLYCIMTAVNSVDMSDPVQTPTIGIS